MHADTLVLCDKFTTYGRQCEILNANWGIHWAKYGSCSKAGLQSVCLLAALLLQFEGSALMQVSAERLVPLHNRLRLLKLRWIHLKFQLQENLLSFVMPGRLSYSLAFQWTWTSLLLRHAQFSSPWKQLQQPAYICHCCRIFEVLTKCMHFEEFSNYQLQNLHKSLQAAALR